jgi:hypothetical protein
VIEPDSLIGAETIRTVISVGLMETSLQCNKYTECQFVRLDWNICQLVHERINGLEGK